MNRIGPRIGVVVSLLALAGAAACSENAFTQVAITTSDAVVAGCQKTGDVSASKVAASADVNEELTNAARKQGANYVVVASEGARTGTGYRCSTPSAAASAR